MVKVNHADFLPPMPFLRFEPGFYDRNEQFVSRSQLAPVIHNGELQWTWKVDYWPVAWTTLCFSESVEMLEVLARLVTLPRINWCCYRGPVIPALGLVLVC